MLKNTHTKGKVVGTGSYCVPHNGSRWSLCLFWSSPSWTPRFFRAPVRSDLTSETERGPFASPQTVKVPQESNAAAYCHDQRSAGKPDGDADAHNCHLKEGGKFSLQRLLFGVCGKDSPFFSFFFASIRIRGENGDCYKAFEDRW